MAGPELFVVCNNCGSEVSPYVTECPYCGTRLRKRAPDLKKQKKLEEKEERKAEKRRERLRSQYEGGGSSPGAWLETASRPVATGILVAIAIVASVIAASDIPDVSDWMLTNLVYRGELTSSPAVLLTAPFIHLTAGYAFVCLFGFAIFGAGLERRFGPWVVVALWFICGGAGIGLKMLIDPSHFALGAMGCVAGALFAWTIYVVNREDLRDYDALGLAAIALVVCALPIATDAASVWVLLGGALAGLLSGFALTRISPRAE
ncbi:MAG: rhomboid family intramembrane serine protease [Thermoleophilaceae bacterium]|nr:rhomboid family intramembrane serine protease [Thermoleophilaceae bacterium]